MAKNLEQTVRKALSTPGSDLSDAEILAIVHRAEAKAVKSGKARVVVFSITPPGQPENLTDAQVLKMFGNPARKRSKKAA